MRRLALDCRMADRDQDAAALRPATSATSRGLTSAVNSASSTPADEYVHRRVFAPDAVTGAHRRGWATGTRPEDTCF